MIYSRAGKFIRLLPAMLWGGIILYLSLLPGGTGIMIFWGIPHFDKIGHFGMYAVWAFLMTYGFSAHDFFSKKRLIIWAAMIGLVVGIGLEFGQKWMHQGRSFEIADMVANTLGVIAGLVAFRKVKWKGSKTVRE